MVETVRPPLDAPQPLSPKQQEWNRIEAEMKKVTDRLGHPIDEGIIKTVVGMNVLGFQTSDSCEGHVNWGTYAPRVSIALPDVSMEMKQAEALFDKGDSFFVKDEKKAEEFFSQAHETRRSAEAKLLGVISQAHNLLKDFYQARQSDFDTMLNIGREGRLQSIGAILQPIRSESERAERLKRYQEEMNAFADFLQLSFFNQEKEIK